jgi:NitT/TauT family transport system ATP-binding protein
MLVADPAVLLRDKPFSALDELTRDFMNMELQRICADRQSTAFLVTHSLAEAVIPSHRVLVMKPRPGRIVEEIVIDLPRPHGLGVPDHPAKPERDLGRPGIRGRQACRLRTALYRPGRDAPNPPAAGNGH